MIAGSTDIPADDPETAVCEEDEVDYVLTSMRHIFPSIHLDRSHIVYRFCGVRPLPRMTAATTGQISRDHHCALTPAGGEVNFPIYSLIGGKWTTFRAFAEQVANQLLPALGKSYIAHSEDVPIGGGKNYPQPEDWLLAMREKHGSLADERLLTLLQRYGTRAEAIIDFMLSASDSLLEHHPGYSRREVQFMAINERVVHLDDLILRRTLMGLLGELDRDLLEELTNILAPVLDWSPDQIRQEVERTMKILETIHGVNLAMNPSRPRINP